MSSFLAQIVERGARTLADVRAERATPAAALMPELSDELEVSEATPEPLGRGAIESSLLAPAVPLPPPTRLTAPAPMAEPSPATARPAAPAAQLLPAAPSPARQLAPARPALDEPRAAPLRGAGIRSAAKQAPPQAPSAPTTARTRGLERREGDAGAPASAMAPTTAQVECWRALAGRLVASHPPGPLGAGAAATSARDAASREVAPAPTPVSSDGHEPQTRIPLELPSPPGAGTAAAMATAPNAPFTLERGARNLGEHAAPRRSAAAASPPALAPKREIVIQSLAVTVAAPPAPRAAPAGPAPRASARTAAPAGAWRVAARRYLGRIGA